MSLKELIKNYTKVNEDEEKIKSNDIQKLFKI